MSTICTLAVDTSPKPLLCACLCVSVWLCVSISGFHLGFSSRGGGGEVYSNTFSLAMNITELIDFLKVGDLVVCSPRKNFNFLISDTISVCF